MKKIHPPFSRPPQLGFCCIWLGPNGLALPRYKFASATVAYVSKLEGRERQKYVQRIVEQNLEALDNVVRDLSVMPYHLRMFRITSGMLPLYTHECVRSIYKGKRLNALIEESLAKTGAYARPFGVRLSLHPGQFTVLSSQKEKTRIDSIAEFEYHCRIATMLGFRGCNGLNGEAYPYEQRDAFAVNVHGGPWLNDLPTSIAAWRWSWSRLSREARSLITLENDEFGWGLPSILKLAEELDVRVVLDVHHHFVRVGKWLTPDDPLALRTRKTWEHAPFGHLPKLHVSTPMPETVGSKQKDRVTKPREYGNWEEALPSHDGSAKTKVRAHSDYLWPRGMPGYLDGWMKAGWSIQVESKSKQLATYDLAARLDAYNNLARPPSAKEFAQRLRDAFVR